MTNRFAGAAIDRVNRSVFDRSFNFKTTLDGGDLVPIMVDEVYPGDTFNLNLTGFGRIATLRTPLMDNIFADYFFFFIPMRLVWDNFQKFMGERVDPDDTIDFLIPQVDVQDAALGSLPDYFGIPLVSNEILVNALPFRAYNLVWNTWFRSQDLQDSLVVDKDNGPDTFSDYPIRKRGKRHDYFTSCLPNPQKGDAVDLPLGDRAEIRYDGFTGTDAETGNYVIAQGITGADAFRYAATLGVTGTALPDGNQANIYTDLSTATAATVNQLRTAVQLQKMFELEQRGGSRYIEIVKNFFGVTSPDARLQRPEYLGGGSIPVNITQVPQTSESGTTKQGTLTGIGTVSGKGVGFTSSFTEHGYILGLVSFRGDLSYSQGLDRMWTRSTRDDFYWPMYANLGEQAVLQKEIWWDNATPANREVVFGYQERYGELRYKKSLVTGLFRPDAVSSLSYWTLTEDFASAPTLNDSFIQDPLETTLDNAIAVPTEPQFIYDQYVSMKCVRPMPVRSIPGKGITL